MTILALLCCFYFIDLKKRIFKSGFLLAWSWIFFLLETCGEFKHEVRQFQKPYDNQQAEQISLMV
ncbi:hypothetical protein, partial [Acinetobacter baumannii]|uniref:hypothetical protein n=1 Tax=Acinetobacter baumannii TaxID=470 RepID=UPI001C0A0DDE